MPLPALIASADDRARLRFLEFFAVTIRNAHTRRAYARAAGDFLTWVAARGVTRSEEHTSELQSLMRISYAVFCLKKKKQNRLTHTTHHQQNNQYTHTLQ